MSEVPRAEARNGVRVEIRRRACGSGAGALAKPVSNRHRNERNQKRQRSRAAMRVQGELTRPVITMAKSVA